MKSFLITESERSKILNLHYKTKNYLNEDVATGATQTTGTTQTTGATQTTGSTQTKKNVTIKDIQTILKNDFKIPLTIDGILGKKSLAALDQVLRGGLKQDVAFKPPVVDPKDDMGSENFPNQ